MQLDVLTHTVFSRYIGMLAWFIVPVFGTLEFFKAYFAADTNLTLWSGWGGGGSIGKGGN